MVVTPNWHEVKDNFLRTYDSSFVFMKSAKHPHILLGLVVEMCLVITDFSIEIWYAVL